MATAGIHVSMATAEIRTTDGKPGQVYLLLIGQKSSVLIVATQKRKQVQNLFQGYFFNNF